ncbi:hypothetical protein M0804_010079 [Polistes exclamans]|nr:hypothetical protein M0804_010079 [Polistes exclamans]
MVQAIRDDSTISLPVTEIVNIASRLSDEEFAVNHQDVRELVLREETLDEDELMELIDAPTSNALVNENKENKWVPNLDLQDVKKVLNLAEELELHANIQMGLVWFGWLVCWLSPKNKTFLSLDKIL